MDATDRQILDILQRDTTMPLAETPRVDFRFAGMAEFVEAHREALRQA